MNKYPVIKRYSKKNNPSLSVIICTVNRVKELDLCLNSLKYQKLKDFEVIIVDGRKDEKLDSLCKIHSRYFALKRVKINKWNLAYSRNVGISHMDSDIACFIDDDAMASYDWLENIDVSYKKDRGLKGVGGKILSANKKYLSKFAEYIFNYGETEKNIMTITGANMSFNIGRIRKSGKYRRKLFNENFVFAGEETEACFNIVSKGGKLIFNPTVIVNHFFESNFIPFIKKHIKYGAGDYLVANKKKYTKFELLGDNTLVFKLRSPKISYPFASLLLALKKSLKFCSLYGFYWLPAILVREVAYSLGIYSALLKTSTNYNKLPHIRNVNVENEVF